MVLAAVALLRGDVSHRGGAEGSGIAWRPDGIGIGIGWARYCPQRNYE
jgi:hypothetical protein